MTRKNRFANPLTGGTHAVRRLPGAGAGTARCRSRLPQTHLAYASVTPLMYLWYTRQGASGTVVTEFLIDDRRRLSWRLPQQKIGAIQWSLLTRSWPTR